MLRVSQTYGRSSAVLGSAAPLVEQTIPFAHDQSDCSAFELSSNMPWSSPLYDSMRVPELPVAQSQVRPGTAGGELWWRKGEFEINQSLTLNRS